MKKLLPFLLLLLCGSLAAQTTPTLTFTPQTTTGNGSVIPVLTWSTQPTGATCAAAGDTAWAGSKAASGTQTLAAITSSKTYNLTCVWSGTDNQRVTLNWIPPTLNTDGSTLTDLKGHKVYTSLQPTLTPLVGSVQNLGPGATSTIIGPLTSGTYYFGVRATNSLDVDSDMSNVVSKVVGSTSVTRQVSIVVNPVPMPPSNFRVE